jgi:hypothetical protein
VIVLRAVRVEDDGAETDLGEVRLTSDTGAVYSHLSTAEGGGVVGDLVSRLRESSPLRREVPRPLRPLTKAHPRRGTLQ